MIVMSAPGFDQELGFFEGVKHLPIEQFVSKSAIEAFVISVLPRASRFNKSRLDIQGV